MSLRTIHGNGSKGDKEVTVTRAEPVQISPFGVAHEFEPVASKIPAAGHGTIEVRPIWEP
jgi:hypothetical protein